MSMILNHRQVDYAVVATKLSALLGRKFATNVVFGADPATDGKTVYLPHWNFDDAELRVALFGLVAHEAGGHIRMTDFDALRRFCDEHRQKPDFFLLKSFENLLEDIRIEANILRSYRGSDVYLNAAVNYMLCREPMAVEKCETYWELVFHWCLRDFRIRCLGQRALEPQVVGFRSALEKLVGPDCLSVASGIAIKAANLGGTKGDFQTILHLAPILKEHFEKHAPSKQAPKTDQGAQGDAAGQKADQGAQGDAAGQKADQSAQGDAAGQKADQSALSEAMPDTVLGDIFAELAQVGATDDPSLVGKDASVIPTIGDAESAPSKPFAPSQITTVRKRCSDHTLMA